MRHSQKHASRTVCFGNFITSTTLRFIVSMRGLEYKTTMWILFLTFLLVGMEPVKTYASSVPKCNWPKTPLAYRHMASHLRVYTGRTSEEHAQKLCTKWGKYIGKEVTFTTFGARGLKDIVSRSDKTCAFGFFLNKRHSRRIGQWAFSMCKVAPKAQCAAAKQRRVLPFGQPAPDCPTSKPGHNWKVLDWEQDTESKWIIENNGNELEIRVYPVGSLRTKVTIGDETDYLHVNKIIVKWGRHNREGSDHSFGRHKRAGEIQIFHEHHDRIGGKHALSFLIKERNNPENPAWRHLLHDIVSHCNVIGSQQQKTSPPNIRNLLGEGAHGQVSLQYRLRDYIRYNGPSSEASCEEHTWTVYENAFFLSRSQFTFLRSLKQFSPVSNQLVNLSPSPDNFCQHKGIYG